MLTILHVPHPGLRQHAQQVLTVDDAVVQLMDNMVQIMRDQEGCGLAAPQIGISKRIIVIELEDVGILKMANPEILWRSEEVLETEEGCLSIPGQTATVRRPKVIKMKYLDEKNESRMIETDTFLATCIQHEIDHLNGRLFIDYLSSIKREMIIKKVLKLKKTETS